MCFWSNPILTVENIPDNIPIYIETHIIPFTYPLLHSGSSMTTQIGG